MASRRENAKDFLQRRLPCYRFRISQGPISERLTNLRNVYCEYFFFSNLETSWVIAAPKYRRLAAVSMFSAALQSSYAMRKGLHADNSENLRLPGNSESQDH